MVKRDGTQEPVLYMRRRKRTGGRCRQKSGALFTSGNSLDKADAAFEGKTEVEAEYLGNEFRSVLEAKARGLQIYRLCSYTARSGGIQVRGYQYAGYKGNPIRMVIWGWRGSGTFEIWEGVSLNKVDVGMDVEDNEIGITDDEESDRSPNTSSDANIFLDSLCFRRGRLNLVVLLETAFLKASGSPNLRIGLLRFKVDWRFRRPGGCG